MWQLTARQKLRNVKGANSPFDMDSREVLGSSPTHDFSALGIFYWLIVQRTMERMTEGVFMVDYVLPLRRNTGELCAITAERTTES